MKGVRIAIAIVAAAAIAQAAISKPPGNKGGGGTNSPPPNPQVAYVLLKGNAYRLVVANEDGTNQHELYSSSNPIRFDLAPRAQQQIAINERGTILLLTYQATSTNSFETVSVDTLYPQNRVANFVDFSPDGSKIAFQGGSGEKLMVFDLGTGTASEWASANYIWDMSWYADGSALAFVEPNSTGNDRLYEVTGPGAAPTLLLEEPKIDMLDSARTQGKRLVITYRRNSDPIVGLWENGSYVDENLPNASNANRGTLNCLDDKLAYTVPSGRGYVWQIYDIGNGLSARYSSDSNINWLQFWPTC